jgi:hypothetical protein
MSNNLPSSIIDPTLASQRRNYFLTKKKAVLDGLLGYKQEGDHLTYSVPAFLALLNVLTAKPGQYSGLRVYFASYSCHADDPNNQYIPEAGGDLLTLIFVPTTEVEQNGAPVNEDDPDNCYIIAQDKLIRLPRPGVGGPGLDTASRWVRHYQEKLPALSLDGVTTTGNKNFMDTRSQWYKIEIFTGILGKSEPGLISFIKTLQSDPDNPLVAIVPQFAAYTDTDTYAEAEGDPGIPLHYQLTLLFELRQKNDRVPNPKAARWATKHGADDRRRAAAAKQNAPTVVQRDAKLAVAGAAADMADAPEAPAAAADAAGSDDADTGYPCPPALTCLGSKLPA